MYNWFECKISYLKEREAEGGQKKTAESYLVDALSFTEAEARITEEMGSFTDFSVLDIKKVKYTDTFLNEIGDKFYKIKVFIITLDEKNGVDKRTATTALAQASDLNMAIDVVNEGMKGSMNDYEIAAVTETSLMGVFPYNSSGVKTKKTATTNNDDDIEEINDDFEEDNKRSNKNAKKKKK